MAVEQYGYQETTRMNRQCLTEIEIHLQEIEKKLKGCQDEKNIKTFHDILDNLQVIEDLAMVYGYDGMETLAFHLTNVIQRRIKIKSKIPGAELPRLSLIIKAMRNMYGEDDDNKIFTIVKRAIDEMGNTEKFDEINTAQVSKPTNKKQNEKAEKENTKTGRHLFDIREARSIRKLIHKIETNNQQLPKKTPDHDDTLTKIAVSQTTQKSINQEIEQVFNEVFVEETLESLLYLEEYLQMARDGQSLGESIMHIKDAWSSLADSANCFQISELQTPLSLINKLAHDKLNFNEQPDVDLLDLMDDAKKMIHAYIKDANGDHNFAPIIDRIQSIGFSDEENVDAKQNPTSDDTNINIL